MEQTRLIWKYDYYLDLRSFCVVCFKIILVAQLGVSVCWVCLRLTMN